MGSHRLMNAYYAIRYGLGAVIIVLATLACMAAFLIARAGRAVCARWLPE